MSRLEQTESGNLIVRIQELEGNPIKTWRNKAILMVRLQLRTDKPPDQWIQEKSKAYNKTDCQEEAKDFATNNLIIEE